MTLPPPPPRISVFLARESPVAVILRRGPHKLTQMLKWNTDTDKITPGQWLKARVYEMCCDISPSGKYFVYWAYRATNETPAWTAVSRPPYFTALKFWPARWAGGGLFQSDTELLLNSGKTVSKTYNASGGSPVIVHNVDALLGDSDLYESRIQRDKWRLIESGVQRKTKVYGKFVKRFGKTYSLNMRVITRSLGTDYGITDENNELLISLDSLGWADWSHKGDLLFAEAGKIFRLATPEDGLWDKAKAVQITDLTGSSFEEVAPPTWATKW